MTRSIGRLFAVLAIALVGGCSSIDQFSARVYSSNANSQTALDEETLLNIERAAHFQPLTFVAITKTTGTRTGDLKIGLPTATFGPAQTAIQRQTSFAGNTLDNSMQGTWESNPLITSAFQQGMLTPVAAKTVAQLLGEYPRELVFYAVLDGIEMSGGKDAWYFRNDPSSDEYNNIAFNDECRALEIVDRGGAAHGAAVRKLHLQRNKECNFSEFAYLLEYALAVGLTADIAPAPAPPAAPKAAAPAAKDATPSPTSGAVGTICFDPALSRPELRDIAETMRNPCNPPSHSKADSKFDFNGTLYDINFRFRSPMGIYAFLGKLIRDHSEANIRFQDAELQTAGPLIDIQSGFNNCLVTAALVNESFCLPKDQSEETLVMIGILEQLRNLNIAPTDLNASFSVHVAD
jgi:hypothetical protein